MAIKTTITVHVKILPRTIFNSISSFISFRTEFFAYTFQLAV